MQCERCHSQNPAKNYHQIPILYGFSTLSAHCFGFLQHTDEASSDLASTVKHLVAQDVYFPYKD